jgi:hypothetical protein
MRLCGPCLAKDPSLELCILEAKRVTAITNLYRGTKDLLLTQRFARHASPVTTVAYTHPSDEELYRGSGACRMAGFEGSKGAGFGYDLAATGQTGCLNPETCWCQTCNRAGHSPAWQPDGRGRQPCNRKAQ